MNVPLKQRLWMLTRRDQCYLNGRRASRLNPKQAAKAWQHLAANLERFGDLDVPKYSHLITAIRAATIIARRSVK